MIHIKKVILVLILLLTFTPVYAKEKVNYDIPIMGEVNAKEVSLPIVSIVIGLVDGFNPCAMWILVFLISMLFTLKDRKKMYILGWTFILTSGFVYLLFMTSFLHLATFLTKISLIRLLISIFSIIFGMINIYKYFDEKEVGCKTTNINQKRSIMQKIRKIVSEKKFILSLIGIIVLAFSVNVLELVCSLGLPLVFTNILALNKVNIIQRIIYMGLYIICFLLDDIIVFTFAMKSLKIKGISNKYTKYSHLIGGLIMVIIGLIMAIKPEILMFNF